MSLLISNSSSLQEALRQAVDALGWQWILIAVAESLLWFALRRKGFRLRRLPDYISTALRHIRGFLKPD